MKTSKEIKAGYQAYREQQEALNTVKVPESEYAPPRQLEIKTPWRSYPNHTHSFTGVNAGPGQSGKQEGITPMRYETANVATATISVPSDEAKKIDYLNARARYIFYKIDTSFAEMFNLYKNGQPRTYKQLIDAIKNGEYTLDEKKTNRVDEAWADYQDEDGDNYFDYHVFYGIDFTSFPKADYDGREKAYGELRTEFQRVKDTIAIMPAEEALKAVQDFENWKPSNAPTVQ